MTEVLSKHIKQLYDLTENGSYFVYDIDKLKSHLKLIRTPDIKLWYACKANPLSSILQTIDSSQFGFDVSSEGELAQVIKIGVPGERILVTGPGKSKSLFKLALNHNVQYFVIESPTQLDILENLASAYNKRPNVLIRLQLLWNNQNNEITNLKSVLGGLKLTPFGVDIKTARKLLKRISLPFLGFHAFQWSNILDIDILLSIWKHTMLACQDITRDFDVLDVGGGLGIAYQGENELDWIKLSNRIIDFKQQFNLNNFWLELGRYAVGSCGYYVTSVVDKKTTYDKDILILQSGVNHLMRPVLTNESFPCNLLRNINSHYPIESKNQEYALHGPLCTALDYLGTYSLPQNIKIGDRLVFSQCGAYGFTESMPFFLGHNLPGEAIIENQQLLVKRPVVSADFWMR